MYNYYLVTGATGFLGRAVIEELTKAGKKIKALVLENDILAKELPQSIAVCFGDVCNDNSLWQFFSDANSQTCVIHCAGIVSVASHPGERIYRVNIGGTNNILRHCEKCAVGKLVYVSSVHAIPEQPKGVTITENAVFSPELVTGDYAKSKAIATSLVFEAAEGGLNVNVVYPSGIIGPRDVGRGSITNMLLSYLSGKLPFAVRGGYDFVDVRDVATGIISCAEQGQPGSAYILSGHYATIRDMLSSAKATVGCKKMPLFLPLSLAKIAAPLYERQSLKKKQTVYFSPYSIAVLSSNGRFSREAASAAFGYSPRPLQSSARDTVLWLIESMMDPTS